MKELNEMVNAAMQEMAASGKIEEIVSAKVEATIKDIIDSELRSYSTFGKALTEHIQKALNVNLDLLNFDTYNVTVLQIIQRILDGRLQDATTKRLEEDLQTLLAAPPEKITISGLIETFIQKQADDCTFENEHEEISFRHIDDGAGFVYVAWDAEPGKDRYACAYQIGFHNGHPFSFRIDGRDPKEKLFMGKMFEFDRTMFQIYAAGTPIELDIDCVETCYPSRDYD